MEARRQCALLRRIVLPTQYAPLLFAYSVPESTYTRYKTIHRIVLLTLVPFGVRFSLIFRNKKTTATAVVFLLYERDGFTVTAIFTSIYAVLKGFTLISTKA